MRAMVPPCPGSVPAGPPLDRAEQRYQRDLRQAEEDLRRLNEELERRVAERTAELFAAKEALERDIEARERAEAALRESHETTCALLDHMLSGVVTVGQDFHIESINPAAAKIFGYEREEVVGKHLSFLLRHLMTDAKVAAARDLCMGRVTEEQGWRKNGEKFTFELSLCQFESATGRHYVGNIRDLSELRELDRLKKEFVSTVSHELRTPLTSIRGSLSLLSAGVLGALGDEVREGIQIAERNCIRLIALINDILDLERIGAGKMELAPAATSVGEILERSIEAVRGLADENGIALEVAGAPATVHGDPDRLVQVVVNLISNAIKFSPPASAVQITAAASDGFVEIAVADRGRGIPAAHRQAIFEPFQQVEASDSRDRGGTGLGLAICRAIVELHGGVIDVESEVGRGSRFWFILPVATSGGSREPANDEREAGEAIAALREARR